MVYVTIGYVSSPIIMGGKEKSMSFLSIFRKNPKHVASCKSTYDGLSDFSSYSSSDDINNDIDNDEEENEVEFEIDFYEELSNGSLIFKIIDDENDPAGHIVRSSKGEITIVENSKFYDFDEEAHEYLKRKVQEFYAAL